MADVAVLSEKTATAATRRAVCSLLTPGPGPKVVPTRRRTLDSGARHTTLSKRTATTAQASWLVSGSSKYDTSSKENGSSSYNTSSR